MKKDKGYYPIPLEDCVERISECMKRRKVIKSAVQENVDNEKAWNTNLMTLLCEYYSINCRYTDLLNDLILTPPSVNEETDDEEVYVSERSYAILSSYSKLMVVDEAELKHIHKINLFIH